VGAAAKNKARIAIDAELSGDEGRVGRRWR